MIAACAWWLCDVTSYIKMRGVGLNSVQYYNIYMYRQQTIIAISCSHNYMHNEDDSYSHPAAAGGCADNGGWTGSRR